MAIQRHAYRAANGQQRPIKRIAATRAGRGSPAGIALESTIGALKSQVRAQGALLACDVALHPARCVDAKLELDPLFSSMVYLFFLPQAERGIAMNAEW